MPEVMHGMLMPVCLRLCRGREHPQSHKPLNHLRTMGCGGSKSGMPSNSTVNPAHPVHQNSLNAGELVTAAALKAKRRANVMAETQEVSEPYVPKNVPKDDRIRALLGAALRENVLFASLGSQEVHEMINAMAPVEFAAGAEVIKQGNRLSTLGCDCARCVRMPTQSCCAFPACIGCVRCDVVWACVHACRRDWRQLLRDRVWRL